MGHLNLVDRMNETIATITRIKRVFVHNFGHLEILKPTMSIGAIDVSGMAVFELMRRARGSC